MILEAVYKCRNCKTGKITVTTVEQTITVPEKLSTVPETIRTEGCPNCCLKTTNNVRQIVVADLIKINVQM